MCLVGQGVMEALVVCLFLFYLTGKVVPVCTVSIRFLCALYFHVTVNIHNVQYIFHKPINSCQCPFVHPPFFPSQTYSVIVPNPRLGCNNADTDICSSKQIQIQIVLRPCET